MRTPCRLCNVIARSLDMVENLASREFLASWHHLRVEGARSISTAGPGLNNSVLLKFLGNFIPNFREWDSEHQELQTKNQNKKESHP